MAPLTNVRGNLQYSFLLESMATALNTLLIIYQEDPSSVTVEWAPGSQGHCRRGPGRMVLGTHAKQ